MAKPAVRIAAIQFGFALGIARGAGAGGPAPDRRGRALGATRPQRQRTEQRGASRPARRALRPERHAARHHPGVLPRRRGAERAGGSSAAAFGCWSRNLGVSAPALNREFRARKRWIYLHGPFNATQVQPLRQVKGIHLTGEFQRFYPSRDARAADHRRARARPAGRAARASSGRSTRCSPAAPGEAVLLKDRAGRRYDSPGAEDARPGGGKRRRAHARRRAAGDRRARAGRRHGPDAGRGRRRRLPRPETGRAAGAGLAAGEPGRGAERASTLHRPVRARLDRQAVHRGGAAHARSGRQPTDAVSGENGAWHMPVTTSGRTRRITDAHRTKGTLTLARGHPGLEQRRHGEVLLAAHARGTVRDAARLRVRDADRRGVPVRVARAPGAAGPLAADVHPRQHGDGLRVRRDAGAARGGVWGHRQRRHAARADAGARGAGSRRASCSTGTSPSRCGGWSAPEVAAQLREFLREAVGRGRHRRDRRSSPTTRCSGKTGTAVRFENGRYVRGEYTASFAALFPADHPQLVVIVKIDNPKGQLLRRAHGRAGDAHDAAAGARLPPGRDRPRPPRGARHRGAARRPLGAPTPAGPPPVVVLPYRPGGLSAGAAAGAGRRRPLDSRGGAGAAPAGIPGEPPRARAGRAHRARRRARARRPGTRVVWAE